MRRSSKPGSMSKRNGYLNQVYAAAYDLKGMLEAYGADNLHLMVDALQRGDYTQVKKAVANYNDYETSGAATLDRMCGTDGQFNFFHL